MKKEFSSKAENLLNIKKLSSKFNVPKLLTFSAIELKANSDSCFEAVRDYFDSKSVAIRSSAGDEDNIYTSAAGLYESVLNVPSDDKDRVQSAITEVISSYEKIRACKEEDRIIVQEMVNKPSCSGVVFTHELNTGAPYYVINYDDVSGLTNTVTSGDGEYANRTLYAHRGASDSIRSERFKILLSAVAELELIMNNKFLDIEFAIDSDLTVHLFQVRSITTLPNWNRSLTNKIDLHLDGIKSFVGKKFRPMANICGETTVFSQMSDWNPAEIIGRAPRVLSLSLYETLITDSVWSKARKIMGYDAPTSHPLMVSLAGQPFIDTRLSFQSFLPEGLPRTISEKLVTSWVTQLKKKPELHDKVEFEVAMTSYCFHFEEKAKSLIDTVLTEDEKIIFKNLLHTQTIKLVKGCGKGSIESAMKLTKILESKQCQFGNPNDDVSYLRELIDNCKEFGTLPFSMLARHGFIAKNLLLSLQESNILEPEEVDSFQASISTVASELVEDMHQMELGNLSLERIIERYGHLRPGTYDILSLRYDQMTSFGKEVTGKCHKKTASSFHLSLDKKLQIDQLLKEHEFKNFSCDDLFNYFRQAIIGREYGKFIFTKTLSYMLEIIANFGEKHGLSRDEMSHVPINAITNIASKSLDTPIEEHFRQISHANSEKYTFSLAIRLPQVLFDEEGIDVIPFQVSQPNFITKSKVTGSKVTISSHEYSNELEGKIVLIENADPGFDWIFLQNIAGLVTKFGGANSHMSIRCAEFSIPAAIGCGEQRFESLLNSKYILLDAGAGLVQPLH